MKRLLGMTLAAALLAPGLANAEILRNLKVDGSLDVQAVSGRNVTNFTTRGDIDGSAAAVGAGTKGDGISGNDRIGTVVTRLLLNAKWDLLDDVHAVVTLRKNDRTWGGNVAGGQGATKSQSITAAADGSVLGDTYLDRANVTIDKLGGYIDTTVGRQYYGDQGDLVIYYGPKDNFGLFVTAIDAARFEYANDWMAFSGLAGKTKNSSAASAKLGTPSADTDVRGFDILWKNLPVKVHTFIWNQVTQAAGQLGSAPTNAAAGSGGLNDNLYVYGLKLHGEAMGGWLTMDLASNSGEDRSTLNTGGGTAGQCGVMGCNALTSNYTGKAFMLDAGYNADMGSIGAFTPWLNFGWGTGRSSNLEKRNEGFTSIASDYRPGIMNRMFDGSGAVALGGSSAAGAIGTNGLNNRVVYGAGLNFTPAALDKLTVGAQLWDYNLQRITATNASTAGTATGAKHLGTEYGLTADWKHSDNVHVGVGASIYEAGGVVKQAIGNWNRAGVSVGDNPAVMSFADLSVKF